MINPVKSKWLALIARKYLNKYEAVEDSGARKAPEIERGGEERILKAYDRLKAIAIGRNLERNSSKAITLIEQVKVLTAGKVKAQFNLPDEQNGATDWNKKASHLFNVEFARDCFYSDPMNFTEFVQLVIAAIIREGDLLIVFDSGIFGGSGKLFAFEADQIVNVIETEWRNHEINTEWGYQKDIGGGKTEWTPYPQNSGVITDQYGKTIGYIVSNVTLPEDKQRGTTAIPYHDAVIIPADSCRLAMRRFRHSQKRGIASFLPIENELSDSEAMRKMELMTAKKASQTLAFVEHSKETTQAAQAVDFAKIAELMEASKAEPADAESADGTVTSETKTLKRYRNFEELLGGAVEYGEEGDKMNYLQPQRPNMDVPSFYDHCGDTAGASLGLASSYTRMKVNNSYTGHRGEMLLTMAHIKNRQKLAEWCFLDWIAEKVIRWYIKQGKINDPGNDWQTLISWDYPVIPYIDPQKDIASDASALKTGKTTFRKLLGPSWREQLEELARELEVIREKKLPLNILETVAGAAAAGANTADDKTAETTEEK